MVIKFSAGLVDWAHFPYPAGKLCEIPAGAIEVRSIRAWYCLIVVFQYPQVRLKFSTDVNGLLPVSKSFETKSEVIVL